VDYGNHRIQKFDSDGNFLAKWGSYGSEDGQFIYPFGIAFDSEGNFYVTERGNHRVQKFAPGFVAQIENLINDLYTLIDEGVLNQGEVNAVVKKLENALKSLEKENTQAAINQLEAFIHQVNALIYSGRLTPEQGQGLIDAAQSVIDELCGW